MTMNAAIYDIEHCQNNGVIAIRPGAGGRLKHLYKTGKNGGQRVWIFGDPTIWEEDGEEHIDRFFRGVSNGTFDEGRALIELARAHGFRVQALTFFVPFSNGRKRSGKDLEGKPMHDYTKQEIAFMRFDNLHPNTLERYKP